MKQKPQNCKCEAWPFIHRDTDKKCIKFRARLEEEMAGEPTRAEMEAEWNADFERQRGSFPEPARFSVWNY